MPEKYVLKLYVAVRQGQSTEMPDALSSLLTEALGGGYELEVINITNNIQRAKEDQIFIIPTLIKLSPLPLRKIIGDFSDKEKVLSGLGIKK